MMWDKLTVNQIAFLPSCEDVKDDMVDPGCVGLSFVLQDTK
jgi:hypothetical protein